MSKKLHAQLKEQWPNWNIELVNGQVSMEVPVDDLKATMSLLKRDTRLDFDSLMDVCGVDYLHYGCSEWVTNEATRSGFERGVRPISESNPKSTWTKSRFAVVYQLLSVEQNHRLRVKTFLADEAPIVDSVVELWNGANWFEREAFDLYGILFKDHPDLRRILTDYGFIGYPFRKDFPLVGELEVRYDAKERRVLYEPVDIVPRTLVPKVIRKGQ